MNQVVNDEVVVACRPASERQHIHIVSAQSSDGVLSHCQHCRRPSVSVGQMSRGRRQVYCRRESSTL